MAEPNPKWYLPGGVVPGARRETTQEFFSNVLELGKFARARYLAECKAGTRKFDQAEMNHLNEQIDIVEAELAKVR